MAFNLAEFRSNMIMDGDRRNLFSISLNFPAVVNSPVAGTRLTFLANAATLPGSTTGIASAYYFGREQKFSGDRTVDNFAFTVYNDEDFVVRNAFEKWSEALNSFQLNMRNPAAINILNYAADVSVIKYSKTGIASKTYTLIDCFPIAISPMDLDWSSQNEITQTQITMAVNSLGASGTIPR